jgi:hypothetical protein
MSLMCVSMIALSSAGRPGATVSASMIRLSRGSIIT